MLLKQDVTFHEYYGNIEFARVDCSISIADSDSKLSELLSSGVDAVCILDELFDQTYAVCFAKDRHVKDNINIKHILKQIKYLTIDFIKNLHISFIHIMLKKTKIEENIYGKFS